jgi:GxxExxY protein
MIEEGKYKDWTGKIIGSAMEVHNVLSSGFQEVIYQRALDIEMRNAGLVFTREQEMSVQYKGAEIGNGGVYFIVEGKIPVELKAINLLEDVYLAQTVNYLEVGLLIIFGNKKLECKCLVKPKFKQQIK